MRLKRKLLFFCLMGVVLLVAISFLFFNYDFNISGKVVNGLDSKYDSDIDGDGIISLEDFKILNSNHGEVSCKGPGWCSGSDINKDGVADINDFEILSEAYASQNSLSESEESFKDFPCGGWSECEADYSLDELIDGQVFLEGEMVRMCGDNIERKKCKTGIPITTKKVTRCSKEYVEVYDLEESLISRLELVDGNYRMLNIELSADEGDDCF